MLDRTAAKTFLDLDSNARAAVRRTLEDLIEEKRRLLGVMALAAACEELRKLFPGATAVKVVTWKDDEENSRATVVSVTFGNITVSVDKLKVDAFAVLGSSLDYNLAEAWEATCDTSQDNPVWESDTIPDQFIDSITDYYAYTIELVKVDGKEPGTADLKSVFDPFNTTATFDVSPTTCPVVTIAGLQVHVFLDERGSLHVSVYSDDADEVLPTEGPGIPVVRMRLNEAIVYANDGTAISNDIRAELGA